jgi:hypothetical protein
MFLMMFLLRLHATTCALVRPWPRGGNAPGMGWLLSWAPSLPELSCLRLKRLKKML